MQILVCWLAVTNTNTDILRKSTLNLKPHLVAMLYKPLNKLNKPKKVFMMYLCIIVFHANERDASQSQPPQEGFRRSKSQSQPEDTENTR
jgi:hypothetical protein